MLYFRYYNFSCSNCGRQYGGSLSPFQLGTGRRRCKKCEAIFADSSKEWPELTKMQKFEYVFPTTVLGYIGGFLIAIGAAYTIGSDLHEKLFLVEMILLLMGLPWIPYFIGRAKRARESAERFERHRVFGDTDEFILST